MELLYGNEHDECVITQDTFFYTLQFYNRETFLSHRRIRNGGCAMLLLEFVCPQCGSPLGAFDIRKGLPCEKCGIFFQTAWKTCEDGKRLQYLKQVEKEEKQKKG